MLIINPDDCIDCGLCEPECPVNAIWSEDEVPPEEVEFIEINAKKCYEWPVIDEEKEPIAHESPYSISEAIKIVQMD